jgi:hypothetical protein
MVVSPKAEPVPIIKLGINERKKASVFPRLPPSSTDFKMKYREM